MYRVLFLCEGPSDHGIGIHIENIVVSCGIEIQLTIPDSNMIPGRERTVSGKLEGIKRIGGSYDVVLVHRDADRDGRERRVAEIRAAVEDVMPDVVHAPVVPVRMTEAWLVLDERLIREVAGNPNGKISLRIPSASEAERIADPKALLKELLCVASGLTGRRRRAFAEAFSHNRKRILERLDPDGPVGRLQSWKDFHRDVRDAFARLEGR